MNKSIIVIVLSCIGFSAYAGTTYTNEELNRLVESGTPPKEMPEQVDKIKPAPFPTCKLAINNIYKKVHGEYPVEITGNGTYTYAIKVWTYDGVAMTKCIDGNRILSGAEYE